jgi:hypothetical protein
MADERWRTTDGPYPVLLCMPGMDYSMTVGQAMALVRAAPRLAGPWEVRRDEHASRYDAHGAIVAKVWHQSTDASGRECWVARTAVGDVAGVSLADAMVRANEALRAAGWVLDDDPTRGVRG